jgi:hypothetical protein
MHFVPEQRFYIWIEERFYIWIEQRFNIWIATCKRAAIELGEGLRWCSIYLARARP